MILVNYLIFCNIVQAPEMSRVLGFAAGWFRSNVGYKASEIVVMDRVQAYMDGPRLLRMRLGELVPLVGVELHSWGWGLASLPSLHSLAWNCTLRFRWLTPSPGIYGMGGGCAPTGSTR